MARKQPENPPADTPAPPLSPNGPGAFTGGDPVDDDLAALDDIPPGDDQPGEDLPLGEPTPEG